MQRIDGALFSFFSQFNKEAAEKMKIAENNAKVENAVRRTWNHNPLAADLILAHINSIYFIEDTRPKKGAAKNMKHYIFGIYVDDSTVKSDIDHMQEHFRLSLANEGIHYSELQIKTATLDMRHRHLYPESVKKLKGSGLEPQLNLRQDAEESFEYFEPVSPEVLEETVSKVDDPDLAGKIKKAMEATTEAAILVQHKVTPELKTNALNRGIYEQSQLLELFKRAICLAIEDTDLAYAVLEKIEGAAMDPVYLEKGNSRNHTRYRCCLYTQEAPTVSKIIKGYQNEIAVRARRIGLDLVGVTVRSSPDFLKGKLAFPKTGHPVPIKAFEFLWEKEETTESPLYSDFQR